MMQALEGVIGYSRMRTILVCNYKGGVGKTTVALHLAWLLEQARNPKKDPLPIGAADVLARRRHARREGRCHPRSRDARGPRARRRAVDARHAGAGAHALHSEPRRPRPRVSG